MSANSPNTAQGIKIVAQNRKALHDYEVLQRVEAGIELRGTEVKVIREGHASLVGAYADIDKYKNEAWLIGVNIPLYGFGNIFNHDTHRNRRLLLHKREILKLREHTERKGNTLVPLSLYLKKGKVKCQIGICRGKAAHDKRETIRRREGDLQARRAVANAMKRR